MADQSVRSVGTYLDQQVENNELGISKLQTFLNTKHSELAELQKILIDEIEQLQATKQKNSRMYQLLHQHVHPLISSLKHFHHFLIREMKAIANEVFQETSLKLRDCLFEKETKIKEQREVIGKIRQELKEIKLKSSENLKRSLSKEIPKILEKPFQPRILEKSSQKRKSPLAQSSFLQYHLKRREKSKSKEQSPCFKPSRSMTKLNQGSETKRMMREIQKTLREDHSKNNIQGQMGNSQKKYVKQKIQYLKSKNKVLGQSMLPCTIKEKNF